MPNSKLATIYIVRHGQSEANALDVVGSDTDLTDQGKQEAEKLAEKLKNVHFDAAFSSDLIRAKRTAEIITLKHKLNVTAYKELRERHYGEYDGVPGEKYRAELRDSFEKMNKMTYEEIRKYRRYESFETDDEVLSRFLTILRELAIAYREKTILVASHATLMKTLLIHLGYITYEEAPPIPVANTGYIVLESDGVDFFIKETSEISKTR